MNENQYYNKMNYSEKILVRFFSKIIYPENIDECWLWKAGHFRDGYASFWFNNKVIHASRFIYECYNGPLLPKEQIRHKVCDNKGCVNPYHLLKGSHLDNMKDRDESGLTVKGSKHWRSLLTEKNVENIINDCLNGKFSCMSEIEQNYKIDRNVIWSILARKTWKDITIKFSDEQLHKISDILNEKPLKANINKIKDIKRRLNNRESGISIAKIHKVTPSMISYIKNGTFYSNIQG